MDVKGQVSVEFLLLVLVILIILTSVTIPLIGKAIDSSMAVSDTSDVSVAVNEIANAVGLVYSNGPGSKRTLNIYFPSSGTLSKGNNMLTMGVNLPNGNPVTVNGTNKIVNSSIPYNNININNPNVSQGFYNVTVKWDTGSSFIVINLAKT